MTENRLYKTIEQAIKETGQTMYTELDKLGFYSENDGVVIEGVDYYVSLNMMESKNGHHIITLENTDKFVSRIDKASVTYTSTLKEALLDYVGFKKRDCLEYDIKCNYEVDDNDTFYDYGYIFELVEPNKVKVVNLNIELNKINGKYYTTGYFRDGTHFETCNIELKKAIKETADFAYRCLR